MTVLAIIAVAGIPVLVYAGKTRRRLLRNLWWISVLLVPVIIVCLFAVDYYHWVDKWEGEVASASVKEGWSLRTGGRKTVYVLIIKLEGVGPAIEVTVSSSAYSQIAVGDYVTKKQGSHLLDIQMQ